MDASILIYFVFFLCLIKWKEIFVARNFSKQHKSELRHKLVDLLSSLSLATPIRIEYTTSGEAEVSLGITRSHRRFIELIILGIFFLWATSASARGPIDYNRNPPSIADPHAAKRHGKQIIFVKLKNKRELCRSGKSCGINTELCWQPSVRQFLLPIKHSSFFFLLSIFAKASWILSDVSVIKKTRTHACESCLGGCFVKLKRLARTNGCTG